MIEGLFVAAIHWRSLPALVLASAAIMGSPGPATISLVAVVGAYGLHGSLPYVSGLIIGSEVVLVAVATGVTGALLAVPSIRLLFIVLSATYILRLAYHIATAPPLSKQQADAGAPSLAAGTWLGIANPKGWVAMAAVFATARIADAPLTDAVAKASVMTLMIILIMIAWLLAGVSLAPLLGEERRARAINASLAATLIAATALALLH